MSIQVKVDAQATLNEIARVSGDQWPFILAKSLTNLAQLGRDAGQARTRSAFRLSTDFIPKGIGIVPAQKEDAKKGRASAAVVSKEGISKFMPAHEFGAEKTPTVGKEGQDRGKYLAVPGLALKRMQYRTASGKVKTSLRPGALLKSFNARGSSSTKGKAKGGRGGLRKPFIMALSGNKYAIARRTSSSREGLDFLYFLVPRAKIRPEWNLTPEVREKVGLEYVEVFRRNFVEAMGSAR